MWENLINNIFNYNYSIIVKDIKLSINKFLEKLYCENRKIYFKKIAYKIIKYLYKNFYLIKYKLF